MTESVGFSPALARLDQALSKLEKAVTSVGNKNNNVQLSAIEAERDLLQIRHRRLIQKTEGILSDIDALIASNEGN